jgi:hypothetical protein
VQKKRIKNEKEKNSKLTIIVTGNGFDLECGLGSTYNNFFKWRIENDANCKCVFDRKDQLENEPSKIFTYLGENPDINVWELILIMAIDYADNSQWYNIEQTMSYTINNYTEKKTFWDIVIDRCNKRLVNFYLEDDIMSAIGIIMYKRYYESLKSYISEISSESFYISLLKELNAYEAKFSEFLKEKLESTENYFEKQKNLIEKIFKMTVNDGSYKIVSFNYTPYLFTEEYLNIHGNLEKPIFGINSVVIDHKYAPIFTKPFRRIIDDLDRIKSFIGDDYENVIFYGSSFSDLDLDHFTLILKNKSIKKIFFCYTEYDGVDRRVS